MDLSRDLKQQKQPSISSWQPLHTASVNCYANFLLDLAERVSDEPLSWSFVKG